ncbi:orotate phosphoribosyltransferase [Ferroplasma acidiphilum]|uniref:Orotate phosphoribosyltransferase n=1 Tax=Ferroplasma acidiphilum TaxID=74969 RepID=A0A7K4FNP4_9ARCH|nr:orotate phosphoribosyltransferase [Ferroplasma acidiphilum]NOL60634.1 orotate phosphoribosyltransferase [Ferroplasma acidiphilum]
MDKEKFIQSGMIKFGDFTLTSGKKSTYYVDIKEACTDPTTLSEICDDLAGKTIYDTVAGMELGADTIIVGISLKTGKPYIIIRKGEREHGTKKQIVGNIVSGSRIDLIEDVVTTGNSLLKTAKILRENGAIVDHAVCVVDRESGGEELLKENGIKLESVAKISELL